MVFAGNYGGEGGGIGCSNMGGLPLQIVTSWWFMIFGTILIMAAAGATYMFGLYTGDIKLALGYDQTTLNLLSFFKDLGASVGVLSGLINEVTAPWVVLSIGAVMNFFGHFMLWLALTNKISKPQVWHMCLYICIGASSQSFANTGALVTAVKNFPESRGVVLGLLTGFVGLSGAIITQLYHAVYYKDSKSFILMVGWFPTVISFVFLRTIRIVKVVRLEHELKVFYRLLYMSLGLAGFIMVMIIIQNKFKFSHGDYGVTASVVVILLFLPIDAVIKEELDLWRKKRQALDNISQLKVTTEAPKPEVAPQPSTEPVPPTSTIASSSELISTEVQEVSCWKTVPASE